MKMKKEQFINEITNNFSDLFIEAFLIRYLSLFNGEDLEEDIKETLIILEQKLKKVFKQKI